MNISTTVHPKLQHFGLVTSKLDAMIDWYRKVLGMTVNHRSESLPGPRRSPWLSSAFLSNDEVNHRIAMFEMADVEVDASKNRHARVQHFAFEYETLDDLLGTYVRLKDMGILPVLVADQGVQMVFYYSDPDQNTVELNIGNFGNEWTATEFIKASASVMAFVDPEKMILARKSGASPWDLHERAVAGEFAPARPYDGRALL